MKAITSKKTNSKKKKEPQVPLKQVKVRFRTGKSFQFYLDETTISSLKSTQAILSKPCNIEYSTSAIVRRALQLYEARTKQGSGNIHYLKAEGEKLRMVAASIPLEGDQE